jgi:2-succinyl-6-hydroxy-2,4-cyclohexadiene-1-carboxylate synthase
LVKGSGRRIAFLHGFTQNQRCWGPLLWELANEHEIVAVDAPGHGESGHDRADLWEAARLVGETVGPAIYVGYSMGGRTALHLALAHPELVEGLVLIGATAGLVEENDRHQRRQADDKLASHLLDVGLETFLDEWLAGPLFASLSSEATCRPERLTNRAEGLAASLRQCGTGSQDPLWDRLHELTMPVVALAGADDAKFSALADRMVSAIGANGSRHVEPGGHAVHLEQPKAIAAVIRRFASPS